MKPSSAPSSLARSLVRRESPVTRIVKASWGRSGKATAGTKFTKPGDNFLAHRCYNCGARERKVSWISHLTNHSRRGAQRLMRPQQLELVINWVSNSLQPQPELSWWEKPVVTDRLCTIFSYPLFPFLKFSMATKPQQKEDGVGDDDIRAIFKKMIVKMPPPISPIKDPAYPPPADINNNKKHRRRMTQRPPDIRKHYWKRRC